MPITVASTPVAYSSAATKAPPSSIGPRAVCHHGFLCRQKRSAPAWISENARARFMWLKTWFGSVVSSQPPTSTASAPSPTSSTPGTSGRNWILHVGEEQPVGIDADRDRGAASSRRSRSAGRARAARRRGRGRQRAPPAPPAARDRAADEAELRHGPASRPISSPKQATARSPIAAQSAAFTARERLAHDLEPLGVVTRRPPTNSTGSPAAPSPRRSAGRRRGRRRPACRVASSSTASADPAATAPPTLTTTRSCPVVRVDLHVVVGEVARQVARAAVAEAEIELDRRSRPRDVGLDVGRRAVVEHDRAVVASVTRSASIVA